MKSIESKPTKFKHPKKSVWRIILEDSDATWKKCRKISKKHPLCPIIMNFIGFFLLGVLVIECFAMGIDARMVRHADAMTAKAMEEYQAELDAREQAKRAAALAAEESEQARREADIVLMSKMLYGINKFVETYGYSENDIRTYAECVINRVLSKTNGFASVTSIREAILQKDQWVGFDENNQVIEKYYKIASTVVNNFYDGGIRPCSSDFCWAELTRNGVWLKNEFSDDKYVQTWKYVA